MSVTQKQIEDSPTFEIGQPISQKFEDAHNAYYGLPMYWNGPYMRGAYPNIVRDPKMWKESVQGEKMWDHQLHDTSAVSGDYVRCLILILIKRPQSEQTD